MNNQVFIQTHNTSEKVDDEDIFHNLIEAQVTRSLADIEILIESSPSLSNNNFYSIFQNMYEDIIDEPLAKSWGKQNVIDFFNWLGNYFKKVWLKL